MNPSKIWKTKVELEFISYGNNESEIINNSIETFKLFKNDMIISCHVEPIFVSEDIEPEDINKKPMWGFKTICDYLKDFSKKAKINIDKY